MRIAEITQPSGFGNFWYNAETGERIVSPRGIGHTETVLSQPHRWGMDTEWIAAADRLDPDSGDDELYNRVFTELKRHHWVRCIASSSLAELDGYSLSDIRKTLAMLVEVFGSISEVTIDVRQPKGWHVLRGDDVERFLRHGIIPKEH